MGGNKKGRGGGGSQRNTNQNKNKNGNKKQECMQCGSRKHNQGQCNATPDEKQAYADCKSKGGRLDQCFYCKKPGHVPYDCYHKIKKNEFNKICHCCKERANHEQKNCPWRDQWKSRAVQMREDAFKLIDYCAVCGGVHTWSDCDSGLKEQRIKQWELQSEAEILRWVASAPDSRNFLRDIAFCGYCQEYTYHNTMNCHFAIQYHKNKGEFLLAHFGRMLPSERQAASRRGSAIGWADKKMKQVVYKPLVEKKCQVCCTTLPKVQALGSKPRQDIVIVCINPKCKQLNVLPCDNADGSSSGSRGSFTNWHNTAGAYLSKHVYSFFDLWRVTLDAKTQPCYSGPTIPAKLLSWSFSGRGNYQPFFPPAPVHFAQIDYTVCTSPNIPIHHARNGLIPFCTGCNIFGVVVDDDWDVVMTHTGPDMDGNLAGAGAGNVLFENPFYELGGRNLPNEMQYISHGKCYCTRRYGVGPSIAWVKERRG